MLWQHRQRWAALGFLLGALGVACGAADTTSEGFSPDENQAGKSGQSGAGGAGGEAEAGAGGEAGQGDLADAWPSADPDPGTAPTGAPTFDPPPAPEPTTCGDKQGAKGDRTVTLSHNGLLRTALVHVPASYDPKQGTRLVLNFHGFSSDALQEAVLSRMNAASDAVGFIAVHPYGVANSWNAGQCCGTAWLDAIDDVGFVGKLLDQLEAEYCVDPKRVFATGMSNGGFLSHRLGCEMSDRIAAIAPVAGVMGIPACKPTRPVPVLHFHGTDDGLVPYGGGNPALNVGLQGQLNFISVASSIAGWRDRNGCTGEGEQIYAKGDATCVRWGDCQENAEVILCTIKGGGHTWPGGVPIPVLGKTSTDLSATDAMLTFFDAHPMP